MTSLASHAACRAYDTAPEFHLYNERADAFRTAVAHVTEMRRLMPITNRVNSNRALAFGMQL